MNKLSVFILGVVLVVMTAIPSMAQFEGFSDDNEQSDAGTTDTTGPVHTFDIPEMPEGEGEFNENSVRPIHQSDIMFKKGVWRRIYLEQKQNRPFFSEGREISRIIIEAVQRGDIQPYTNDSLTERMTIDQFMDNMVQAEQESFGGGGFDDFGGFGDEPADDDESADAGVTYDYYLPNQLSILEIREDMIFDKQRSRLYYDIQSVKIVIPASLTPTGVEEYLGTFSYKELVENVFSKDPRAKWFNSQNSAEHKNFSVAFDLRLFSSRIVKVENPNDSQLADIHTDPKRALMASQWAEEELIEFEHNLWEY